MEMTIGMEHTSVCTVTPGLTAEAMGSGDMPVLATPALVALMENAAMMAVQPALAQGETSVGGHIDIAHLRPSPVGAEVRAKAVLTAVDGRRLAFRVEARQEDTLVGEGTHIRFIVDRARFLSRTK